jgi:hypothetical protein
LSSLPELLWSEVCWEELESEEPPDWSLPLPLELPESRAELGELGELGELCELGELGEPEEPVTC